MLWEKAKESRRMNILVLSDSHGNLSNMEEAVERERPQLILHLGD